MELSALIKKYEQIIFSRLGLNPHQKKIFTDIKNCRSPVLGGHLYLCPHCGATHVLYNSCRNRHCPVCQANKQHQWVDKQCDDLINVPYYHLVFTVPDAVNQLFILQPQIMYNVLFMSVWQTVKCFFADPRFFGGTGGMLAMLHTWGQTLVLHPHLHCIIPGAGLDFEGNFKIIRSKDKYLFPVKALSLVFRAKFAAELTRQSKIHGFEIHPLTRCLMFRKNWVVFCKRPFASPKTVVEYLGRYTYKTAISQNRILADDNAMISFSYKDYRNSGVKKVMKLQVQEFFRRFALHFLPRKFVKIRHFGLLSNSNKKRFIENGTLLAGKLDRLDSPLSTSDQTTETIIKASSIVCPSCKTGRLIKICCIRTSLFLDGFCIVNPCTGEIVFRSRDGPCDSIFNLPLTV